MVSNILAAMLHSPGGNTYQEIVVTSPGHLEVARRRE
jgi:hypothetical protein